MSRTNPARFVMPVARLGNADPADDGRVSSLLEQWERMTRQLAHPAVELTIEEISPVLAMFGQLKAAGVPFDPMLIVLLNKLRDQVFGTEDDGDTDPGQNHAACVEPPSSHAVGGLLMSEWKTGFMTEALEEAAREPVLPGDEPSREFLR